MGVLSALKEGGEVGDKMGNIFLWSFGVTNIFFNYIFYFSRLIARAFDGVRLETRFPGKKS